MFSHSIKNDSLRIVYILNIWINSNVALGSASITSLFICMLWLKMYVEIDRYNPSLILLSWNIILKLECRMNGKEAMNPLLSYPWTKYVIAKNSTKIVKTMRVFFFQELSPLHTFIQYNPACITLFLFNNPDTCFFFPWCFFSLNFCS